MSGKSVCKKLLVELCDQINGDAGRRERVEYPCTKEIPALASCCDGMVLLNRIGNVMSRPTKIGEYTDKGFTTLPQSTNAEVDYDNIDFNAPVDDGDECGAPKKDSTYGTWRHMYNAIARELTAMFNRPTATLVVLGFDKKQFVDGVKRITHAKRSTNRGHTREKQIAKDDAAGVTSTRGIPFTFDEMREHALVPYPWNETLHGAGQAAAIIRFICVRLVRHYKPPRSGQFLILDGHSLCVTDMPPGRWSRYEEEIDRIPVYVTAHTAGPAPWFKNDIGEFDHTAFFYVRKIATDPEVHELHNLDPATAPFARMHIRTNDTDTIVMGLVFLERLACIAPETTGMQLVMEIPRKKPAKTDTCIDIQRMLAAITARYEDQLRFPGAYFAYGLYLKENDYDTPFMKGIGHGTFMSALTHYAAAIGDLVEPRRMPRANSRAHITDVGASSSGCSVMIDLVHSPASDETTSSEDDTYDVTRKRKHTDETPTEPSHKRTRINASDSEPYSEAYAVAPTHIVPTAYCVVENAVVRLAAACYYDAVFYRTKDQRETRAKKVRKGTYKGIAPGLLSYEFIVKTCKKRKASAITPHELAAKARRHNYFVAITEDLTLGFPRSIPFSRAHEYGYDCSSYQDTFNK